MHMFLLNPSQVSSLILDEYKIIKKKKWFSGEIYFEKRKTSTTKYTYSYGKISTKKTSYFDENNHVKKTEEHVISENKTLVQVFTAEGYLDEEISYEYDLNHNLIKQESYNHEMVLKKRILYTYNNQGEKTSETTFEYNDGKINKRAREYIYDKNKVTSIYYPGKSRIETEYDSKKLARKMTSYNSEGNIEYTKNYDYDSDGNLTRAIYDKYMCVDEYKYDRYGNRIWARTHDYYPLTFLPLDKRIQDYIYKMEYHYDRYGNWIEYKMFINDVYESLVTRTIRYY